MHERRPRIIAIEIRGGPWGYSVWGISDQPLADGERGVVLSRRQMGTLRGARMSAARWARKAGIDQIIEREGGKK